MIVSEQEAADFIHGYTEVMAEIFDPGSHESEMTLLEVLACGRAKYISDRASLDDALGRLEAGSVLIAPEVESAIRSLEVKQWFCLKDTATYSVFVDPSADTAYAVLGLTERIRDIVGGTGALVEVGLVQYHGHYVCDGLVSSVVWLGRNFRKDLALTFAEIRARGAFRRSYTPTELNKGAFDG
ncbi:MAG: hypothetical protein M1274_14025 [Actinobacteria bacterium]|nr:hypothetical protein [Actinomycetota bacterium]